MLRTQSLLEFSLACVLTTFKCFWEGFEFGFLRKQVNHCELNIISRKKSAWKKKNTLVTLQIACAVCGICKPVFLYCFQAIWIHSLKSCILKPQKPKHDSSVNPLGKTEITPTVTWSTGSRVQRLPGGSRERQRNRSEPELSRPERTHVLLWKAQRKKPPPAPAGQLGANGQCHWIKTQYTSLTYVYMCICVQIHLCAYVGECERGRWMSTFLMLVRVCVHCLNMEMNNEQL